LLGCWALFSKGRLVLGRGRRAPIQDGDREGRGYPPTLAEREQANREDAISTVIDVIVAVDTTQGGRST